ncbi:MAG: FGGY-family carbohydrate kinase [Bacillota bacterium]|nr:FGGY-family carbohydrate kinase [Bacillota bacterium]NLJ02548.1 FGGY-family carbohydrate kinase [Bacillota bacterium]
MGKRYLLGFDCGTYESKGVIMDENGVIVAQAASPHVLKVPQPGFAEHDPINDWWMGFKKIVRELLDKSGVDPQSIAGIGISTIMAAITPVDENFNPLRNAILYGIDTRAAKQAEELNREIGEERMKRISGATCTVESFGPKIKWIRDNEPEVYAKTKCFTIASGFLTARLTGRFCVDRYSAMRAQPMLDYRTMTWSDELTEYVCPAHMLPEIVHTTDVIGTVTKQAAEETGLAEGTPVIAGTTDAGAEAVSVGVVEPGDVMLMYGSTAFMIQLTDRLVDAAPLWSGHAVLKNVYTITSGMATTGSLTRWLRDNFAKELVEQEEKKGINAYAALFTEAENIPAGSDGLIILPYFAGERMPIQDPLAKGVIFGLNLRHTRGHIVKAAFEGVGYGIDQNLQLMRQAGFPLDNVMAVGGGTKSRLWLQTVSDICGIKQTVPKVTFGASYGDAMLAALGVGIIDSPREIKKWIEVDYVTEPNPEHRELYDRNKKHFAELYKLNKHIMHALEA